MFKSFIGRFFTLYAIATFAMFLLLFGVISQLISNHFIGGRQEAMVEEGRLIASQYTISEAQIHQDPLAFDTLIGISSKHIESRILVTDINGTVLFDSAPENDLIGASILSTALEPVLTGKTVQTSGRFNNYYDDLHLLTSVPVYKGSDIDGAVVMFSPHPRLDNDLDYVYQITLGSFLVFLAIIFITTYLYSRNISRSIEAISQSAQNIANGDFTSRIVVQGNDEISQLSKSMNYMATELEKLEDMRKDFIANISHDFRSPLTSIKGFIQAMLDGTIPVERQDKYLNIVLDETDRLTKLTNDILLLTKMENNTVRSNMQDFDLHNTIRKILLQFEQKIIDKHIDFTLLIDRHELFVHADMNQIQRVITNLVDNAIKFCSPNDSIVIETTVFRNKVEVSIKDSGPGISEEDIKYIWDRFHKADRSRGKDKKGIGLGLSIVREIIKAHGEEINVYSQEGKGTTFVFTLALAD